MACCLWTPCFSSSLACFFVVCQCSAYNFSLFLSSLILLSFFVFAPSGGNLVEAAFIAWPWLLSRRDWGTGCAVPCGPTVARFGAWGRWGWCSRNRVGGEWEFRGGGSEGRSSQRQEPPRWAEEWKLFKKIFFVFSIYLYKILVGTLLTPLLYCSCKRYWGRGWAYINFYWIVYNIFIVRLS